MGNEPLRYEGLDDRRAAALLATEGPNELPQADRRTFTRILSEVLREPMLALLTGSGAIYLALGEPRDALVLVLFATFSILVTVIQEARTERVLESLRELTGPRARVLRDGTLKSVPGREVVRGDLLVIGEGDRIAADAFVLTAHDLQVDESLLTGESVPVRKRPTEAQEQVLPVRPGGDDTPHVYSGTLVIRGRAECRVMATGLNSEIGKIGRTLKTLETGVPQLQRQTRRLVKGFAFFGGAVSLLAVLLYGLTRGGWLDALLAGIALGMSMLPEEFPVVLTIFLAMGAWRISKVRVLTRRASAIEALGSATVLCTDKTGTLTENRMSIAELRMASLRKSWVAGSGAPLPEEMHDLLNTGFLACAVDPTDPMDKAFHRLRAQGMNEPGAPHSILLHSYGLRPSLLAVTQIWQQPGNSKRKLAAAKGAPESIASLCKCSAKQKAAITQAVNELAASGLRVLGVARASFAGSRLPETPRGFAFKFLGLVGLADPVRASVPLAVAQCREAGVKVIMITGDYPATARAIAQSAGIACEQVVTGSELESMDESEMTRSAASATVFARIMPEQKLRIVEALKASGEIVAMTGDGVNDAPSLKAADIGIAMGGRGTDVAREASAIVLLDDDFGAIVHAVKLGRRIYDNLRKAMTFIFAVHVPIAGLALLPLVTGMPVMLGPIHIALLEMVIDPVCSLVFEAEGEEQDLMRRPPRPPAQALLSPPMIGWSILQGALAMAATAGIYTLSLTQGLIESEVRALTFFTLVVSIWALILVNRSFSSSLSAILRGRNMMLLWVMLAVTAFLTLTLVWPWAMNFLHFGQLHGDDVLIALAAGLAVFLALQLAKGPFYAMNARK